MWNDLKLCMLVGLVLLTGCQSRQPENVRHISLGIFEVIDCKAGGTAPMGLKGSTEQYCLAATPVVNETDVTLAEARRNESGHARLQLFFRLKAGQRMKEVTERIYTENLQHHANGKLGLVIDGTLVSVPALMGAISDALIIEGAFSWDEAVQIAQSLNRPR